MKRTDYREIAQLGHEARRTGCPKLAAEYTARADAWHREHRRPAPLKRSRVWAACWSEGGA